MTFAAIPPTLQPFFQAIPKVELHCHLLGTVRRATFIELARRAQAPLSDDEMNAFYTRGEKPVGVLRVLRALDQWLLRTPDDLARITNEYLQDAAAHNVRYAEFFWNPTGTVRCSGMGYAQAQAGIVRGIHQARAECGIEGRLIAAVDREASPEEAVQVARWMAEHHCDELLGLGIDYRENDRPPELFAEAYAMARRAGFRTTAHAGEFGMPWTNVRTALDLLQVDRIDHGYTVVDAPEFAARCAERGIVFTVVPSNSYYLRTLPPGRWAADHPIRRMPGLGLKVHPNTDDPTLHQVTPTQAWAAMHLDFGFSLDELRGFMLNGLDGAWIDQGTRQRWCSEFAVGFDTARALL
ncbi:MAG: adenosine deaminase [Ideonella sp.]|jgi:adenine deaminase|nr:adenosine deaminase [Ideonella sp.]MBL0151490.1 adenosine deaminase [Ideonella sp.]